MNIRMIPKMIIEYPNIEGNGEIYLDVLRAICGDTSGKSMVDLMCHKAPYTHQLGFRKRMYVDIQFRGLDDIEEECFFKESEVCKFLNDWYRNKEDVFNVAICSDGIEHLFVEDAYDLLTGMEFCSYKNIIFTPTRDFNLAIDNNPDSHKSSWEPDDFLKRGYSVINFPDFHKQMNQGAFFAWTCSNIEEDFERVKNELKHKSWTAITNQSIQKKK